MNDVPGAALDSIRDTFEYIDRETGELREEVVYGRGAVAFAYETPLGRLAMRLLPHKASSHLYGLTTRLPISKPRVHSFIASLGIDASEAELPVEEYRSLDEFFCRRLKPEARPIDETPDRIVAPADGRTLVFQCLDDREIPIKGCRVRLGDMLADADEAEFYRDAAAIVVRLAPCDYHRFHFPDSGNASGAHLVNGRLHSVHPYALRNGAPSFNNKRSISFLESDNFGRIALIEIGAFAVGTIVQTYAPGSVLRGEEKGCFRFGGSTVVVLLQAGTVVLDEDLIRATERGLETFVKMGTSLGSAAC